MIIVTLVVLAVGAFIFLPKNNNSSQAVNESVLEVEDKRLAKGDTSAPISVVEYADILCPQCARAHNEITPQIEKEYIEPKKAHMEVRLVGVIAPDSERAAVGAYCAAEQGMFWEYLDGAFRETQEKFYSKNIKADSVDLFTQAKIAQFAGRIGLEVAPWQNCMDNNEYDKVLVKNENTMASMKAYGTPFFIMNGESYRGAPPYVFFQKALDAEYKKATQGK